MKLKYKGKRRTDGKIKLFKVNRSSASGDGRTVRVVISLPLPSNLNYHTYIWIAFLSFKRSQYDKAIKKRIMIQAHNISFEDLRDLEGRAEVWYVRMKLKQAIPVDNIKTTKKEWL